uniref:Uncharacterized protein n=1 Tax=Avena sativa TaxID=4498 RepID=A0ACD5T9R9_AVESA
MVASRLLYQNLLDYARFRCVCAQWRSATDSPRGRGVVDRRFHPRLWMMFPEGRGLYPGHPDLGDHIRFFNLDSGAFVRVRLPVFEDHSVLDSINGLLLLQRDGDTAIRLLNPFTDDIVEFPPLKTALANNALLELPSLRSVSTSATFLPQGRITLMLAFNRTLVYAAFATPQDERWTMVSWMAPIPQLHGPVQIQGRLYVANNVALHGSDTNIYEMGAHLLDGPKLITVCPRKILCSSLYLVEYDSEIIVVGHTDAQLSGLKAYKLADIVMGVFNPVTSIGDNTIFLGGRTNLCVSSKVLPTVVGDTIVYYRLGPRCFGQYHLGSATWSQPFDECSLNGIEHGPCSLIRHVLTSCHSKTWNKGTMYSWGDLPSYKWKVKVEFRDGS